MLVKSFLGWMNKASMRERAEAADMLARAYLAGTIGEDDPQDVEAALTTILDDPSPLVRRALAMAFADRRDVPRHIVLGLAADQPEVSALLVARSPALTEADLIELASTGERLVLVAIALRHDVTARVAAEIVLRGALDPTFALIGNREAEIGEADLLAVVSTFGSKPRLREALLARGDLPASVRHALMINVAASLGSFVTDGGFLNPKKKLRLVDETLQGGTVAIARQAGTALPGFIAHLRENGQLTPALLLRSVLGGDLVFIAAALADLCTLDHTRVGRLLNARADAPIVALLKRAELPAFLIPVLTATIRAASRIPVERRGEAFSLEVIAAAQSACLGDRSDEGTRLMALLRRYESEAARLRSRKIAETLKRDVVVPDIEHALLPLDIGPEMLRLADAGGDAVAAELSARPESPPVERRIARARGLVLDEPIPDLGTVIAEWKAERAAAERVAVRDLMVATGNQNARPGRSRVA